MQSSTALTRNIALRRDKIENNRSKFLRKTKRESKTAKSQLGKLEILHIRIQLKLIILSSPMAIISI